MIRAFVDTSVLFSAIISKTGASRELLKRHRNGEVQLVVSEYVALETQRNLEKDYPRLAGSFDIIIDVLSIEFSAPTTASIQQALSYTETKDAPIIAAAIDGNCDYLLTYDRQHLLGIPEVAERSGLKIITSGDLIQLLDGDK